MSSKSKAREPVVPLSSRRMAFFRPRANRVASNTPIGPDRLIRSVAAAPPSKRALKMAASSTVTGPRGRIGAGGAVPAQAHEVPGQGPVLDEGFQQRRDAGDVPSGDPLGGVDAVRPDVPERAGAGLGLVQPPGQRRVRVGEPVLQVLGPHVPDRPSRPSSTIRLARARAGVRR